MIGRLSILQTSEAPSSFQAKLPHANPSQSAETERGKPPTVRIVSAPAPTAPQGEASPETEDTASVFARLIQEITNEPAPRLPPAAVNSRTAPTQTPVQAPAQTQAGAELAPKPKEDVEAPAPALPGRPAQKALPGNGPLKAAELNATLSLPVDLQVQAPTPIKFKLPTFSAHSGEATNEPPRVEGAARHVPPVKQDATQELRPAPALELRIRAQDQGDDAPVQQMPPTPRPSRAQAASSEVKPSEVKPTAESAHADQIIPIASSPGQAAPDVLPHAPPAAYTNTPHAAITPQAPSTNMLPGPKPEPRPAAAMHLEEPLPEQAKQPAPPLRSISIEFTPDGAQDVRLRLAERAGDVHISLHSADPALAGRLSDGVHDLVGTLATAGYDAQAWTAGEDRQNQRQQQYEAPRNRRGSDTEPGAEDFGALVDQPIKEIS